MKKTQTFLRKIIDLGVKHKIWSVIILLVLFYGVYLIYNSFVGNITETRYITANVEKGSIVTTVTGSGQVSALNQVDIKAKTSGDIVYVGAVAGQEVKAYGLIAQIDSTDAAYSLESANISYEKLVTIDPDDLRTAENNVTKARENLDNSYTNARISLISASTDMSDVMSGLDDLFDYNTGFLSAKNSGGSISKDYIKRAQTSWYNTDKLLTKLIKDYRTISSASSNEEIKIVLSEAYNTSISISETAKYTQDAVTYFIEHEDLPNKTESDTAYASVVSLVSKANSVMSSLSSARNSIITTERNLEDAEISLKNLKDGPDILDVRSEALSLKQKQETLSNYYIRAPFDGYIAVINVKKLDSISSGTTVATIITKQKIAEITLNEVDVAKVKVGQKVNITFDALSDLNITGEVSEVDTLGTVSQGVVNYNIKITFDTQDDRVKTGMSVSTSIITDMKTDILTVPSGAIKTENERSYVEVFETPLEISTDTQGVTSSILPVKRYVEVGISDDSITEIISGLIEGEQIVSRTTTSSTKTTTTTTAKSATSLLGGGGVRRN
ncbi:MAG: HlyD family efflux transporter periplasmic adaptor subunit [Candidatus Paceibacterota bacterium]|jgi:HlyD family secretion protein